MKANTETMKQEDKELLLKDLCGRLPYGIKMRITFYNFQKEWITKNVELTVNNIGYCADDYYSEYLPYLRPMSSMTKEERFVYEQRLHDVGRSIDVIDADDVVSHIDWLLSHHFDFHGLIPMGLALEAPEGMYKTE